MPMRKHSSPSFLLPFGPSPLHNTQLSFSQYQITPSFFSLFQDYTRGEIITPTIFGTHEITACPFPTIMNPRTLIDNRGKTRKQKKKERHKQQETYYFTNIFQRSYMPCSLRVDALQTMRPPRSNLATAGALLILFIFAAE